MSQKLLEGEVPALDEMDDIEQLRYNLARATRERDALRAEVIRLRQKVNQVDAPAAQLRVLLGPFYHALAAIFGEIEIIAPDTGNGQVSTEAPAQNSNATAAWQEWKQRLGGAAAKIITALQTHKDADVTQLCILIGTPRKQTIYDAVHKLNKSGLINKNGDRYALKAL